MEKELVLVDTNIIIEVLRNNDDIIEKIKAIGIEKIAVSSVTKMELYYGALNKADLRRIKKYLQAFEVIHINNDISELAIELIEKYAKSHNLNLPDALIASSAITEDLKLLTLNLKDFRYIDGLELY